MSALQNQKLLAKLLSSPRGGNGGKPRQRRALRNKRNGRQRPNRSQNLAGSTPGMALQQLPRMTSALMQYTPPSFRGSGRTVKIAHREYWGDFPVSSAFLATKISLNPGLRTSFPWLWYIANNFEFYKFTRLAFEYIPRCSPDAYGIVQFAVDFDPADATPLSRAETNQYASSATASQWSPLRLVVPSQIMARKGQLYTRMITHTGTDIKTYDLGNLFLVAEKGAATTTSGEVYIDYEVELSEPQLNEGEGTIDGSLLSNTGNSLVNPLGTEQAYVGPIQDVVSVTENATDSIITFNRAWEGLVNLTSHGSSLDNFVTTGTATHLDLTSATNANTSNLVLKVLANAGQTILYHVTGSGGVTQGSAIFAAGNYAEL